MSKPVCRSAITVILVAVTACDGATVTQPDVRPSSALSNSAVVSRFPFPQLGAVVDLEGNFSALFGAAPSEVGAVCDDPDFAPYDLSQVLDVAKPTGANKATIKDTEQQFIIWEGVPVPGEFVSCTFRNQPPLAVGTLRSTYTDNNIFVAPSPGANSFHFRATGTLANPSTGQRYQVLVKFGGRITPAGDFIPDEDLIQLTPVGGS